MRSPTTIQFRALVAIVATALVTGTGFAHTTALRRESSARALTIPTSEFTWPGVFDLVATGFPDGERAAVMHIARSDTSYSLVALQGPPGTLIRFTVVGDSAHVSWNLGRELMFVDLHGTGDSITGQWASGEWSGVVRGARRP